MGMTSHIIRFLPALQYLISSPDFPPSIYSYILSYPCLLVCAVPPTWNAFPPHYVQSKPSTLFCKSNFKLHFCHVVFPNICLFLVLFNPYLMLLLLAICWPYCSLRISHPPIWSHQKQRLDLGFSYLCWSNTMLSGRACSTFIDSIWKAVH